MTADVRVGVSLCIINEQNGNKNILLVWTVTPGSDPTKNHLGFYTHSMMNVFKLCLLPLLVWFEISNKVNLPPQTWLKETNMIKIGKDELFWDDSIFSYCGIIHLFCDLARKGSPNLLELPPSHYKMYWCKLKRKLPIRSCWANFLLGVDETLKSPLHRWIVSYIIRNTNA